MQNWMDVLISPTTSVLRAIQVIDSAATQIAVVVDDNMRLLGTVTDGDVRRAILHGISFDEMVRKIMNPTPIVAGSFEGRGNILTLMKNKGIRHIPIVDESGCMVGLESLDELLPASEKDNLVILMAGGRGSRLSPLTDNCPKPMLRIAGRPVLEIILENFIEHGFRRFYLSTHYKAEMVQQYFADGSRWGVDIRYLHEDEKLGTAGALTLLPERTDNPLIVMNGDLVTKIDFGRLLAFHNEQQAQATMCVREYDFQVPFGVVSLDQHRIAKVQEKPSQKFFVNAGIYVLGPDALQHIKPKAFVDMTDFFNQLIALKLETVAFPIREYWLDIGRIDDYERAQQEGGNPEFWTVPPSLLPSH